MFNRTGRIHTLLFIHTLWIMVFVLTEAAHALNTTSSPSMCQSSTVDKLSNTWRGTVEWLHWRHLPAAIY